MMKKFTYATLALAIFAGAAIVSEVPLVEEARAECSSIWASCSESETSELQSELDKAG